MQVVTSYKTKIKNYNKIFDDTLTIYRAALEYFIPVVDAEWEHIKDVHPTNAQMSEIERLTHGTSSRMAKYDFDEKFHKFPVYLRRAVIVEAIGNVSSHRKNYENWVNNGKQGRSPQLQTQHYAFPAFYKGNMFDWIDTYTVKIKIYHKNDWVWLMVNLRKSDVDYINRYKSKSKRFIPTLEKKGKNWFLRFAFEDKIKLSNEVDVITSVDLGINNAATCSIMLPDGTVIGRKIISLPIENDQMWHKVNKLKKAQQHGARSAPRLWAYVNNYNRAISEKTAKAIVDFASLYNSKVIVFEHLDTQGKKRGSKKQKLTLWCHQEVQRITATKAHLFGMRISTVCAWNTSRLAFDGSGRVERDENNYSMCTFSTGKRYHCDLSASYNIGARYYIREILKSLPVRERLVVEAKVPQLTKRTTCVLSDLISLNTELTWLAV